MSKFWMNWFFSSMWSEPRQLQIWHNIRHLRPLGWPHQCWCGQILSIKFLVQQLVHNYLLKLGRLVDIACIQHVYLLFGEHTHNFYFTIFLCGLCFYVLFGGPYVLANYEIIIWNLFRTRFGMSFSYFQSCLNYIYTCRIYKKKKKKKKKLLKLVYQPAVTSHLAIEMTETDFSLVKWPPSPCCQHRFY